MIRQIKKYRPSLSKLMNLCSINYMLMLKLVANNEEKGQQRHFFISDFLSYTITINEVTRYTTLLTIAQDTTIMGQQLNKLFEPIMVIRLYHDAKMAEVISSQDIKQVKPRYNYPNEVMHLPDEKQQINLFLKEWLQLCHHLGKTNITPFKQPSALL